VFPLFFSTFELSRALAGFGIQFLSQREAIDTEGPLASHHRHRVRDGGAGALHHHLARAGGHAPGEAGGPPDREVAAGREPGASRPRPPLRDIADAGREEASHFAGERLSSDERQREFQVGTLS
jgi:hypothetical protein